MVNMNVFHVVIDQNYKIHTNVNINLEIEKYFENIANDHHSLMMYDSYKNLKIFALVPFDLLFRQILSSYHIIWNLNTICI